jgi:putative multicomponent Na+:H+ antiporter subunit B
VAALVYAVLGAADVALTEALVGTMLAITLYAVAVRSSLIMKLGVLQKTAGETPSSSEDNPFDYLTRELKGILSKRHMRLELVPYSTAQDLQQALMARDIHAACLSGLWSDRNPHNLQKVLALKSLMDCPSRL